MIKGTLLAIAGIIATLAAFHLAGCSFTRWWNPVVQGRTDMEEITFEIEGVKVVVTRLALKYGAEDPVLEVIVTNMTGQNVEIDLRSAKLIFAKDSALFAQLRGKYLIEDEKVTRAIGLNYLHPDTVSSPYFGEPKEPAIRKEKGVYMIPPGAGGEIYLGFDYYTVIMVADSSGSSRLTEDGPLVSVHEVSHQASLHHITLRRADSIYQVPEVIYRDE